MSRARRVPVGLVFALIALSVAVVTSTPARAQTALSSPTITEVTPTQGVSQGGTSVKITGTDFRSGVKVFIGGFPALAVVRTSSTEITCQTPQSTTTSGSANIIVINEDGAVASRVSGFFYTVYEAPLAITSLSHVRGQNSGGATVTIVGTGFSSAASVFFGEVPAVVVNPLGNSAMLVRTPPNVSGPVPVTITNPDGVKVTLANGFTYDGGVTISTVTPGAGPVVGGTTINVSGYGFAQGATIKVGSLPATMVIVVNSTQIVAVTPPGTLSSPSVTVRNPDGQSSSGSQGFTYGPPTGSIPPVLSNVSPTSGPSQGGTQVTVNGNAFSGGATVYFGTVPSPIVSWNGTSSMFARAPSNNTGTVSITVVNSDGATTTLPNAYTYEGTGGFSISGVSPSSGSAGGGTAVTVSGSGFNASSWVTFNGAPALTSSLVGSTQIVAISPPGLSGAVTVAVTQIGGVSASVPAAFTFTGVSPVTPVTPPPPPPVAGGAGVGAFIAAPIFSASGQALVVFGGGTVDQLESASSAAKATGAWMQDATGGYQLLVVGGPAFLKSQFQAKFPGGISGNTVATLIL